MVKKVNIKPTATTIRGLNMFTSEHRNKELGVTLNVLTIRTYLMYGYAVEEILPDGTTVRLSIDNYDKKINSASDIKRPESKDEKIKRLEESLKSFKDKKDLELEAANAKIVELENKLAESEKANIRVLELEKALNVMKSKCENLQRENNNLKKKKSE